MIYSFSPFDDGQISHASSTTKQQNIAKSMVASGTMRPLAHRPPRATARADIVTSAVRRRDFMPAQYTTPEIMETGAAVAGAP